MYLRWLSSSLQPRRRAGPLMPDSMLRHEEACIGGKRNIVQNDTPWAGRQRDVLV